MKFYWDVFGCPLVGVADTPPDRVRTFFGVDARAADAARSGGFACRAAACSRSSSSSRSSRPGPVPWNGVGLTHISFNVQNLQKWHDYLESKGRRDRQQARAIAARPLVLLRQGLRRQPDRADGSRLHVPRAELARTARRMDLPARDVQEVLRLAFFPPREGGFARDLGAPLWRERRGARGPAAAAPEPAERRRMRVLPERHRVCHRL